mmetsp:Transcript_42118/g.88472  ORF Transcript_42118/g.88472 Transcript_42118/m.88472 type:complete len:235 (-) Transcript_42118:3522-4226(-)
MANININISSMAIPIITVMITPLVTLHLRPMEEEKEETSAVRTRQIIQAATAMVLPSARATTITPPDAKVTVAEELPLLGRAMTITTTIFKIMVRTVTEIMVASTTILRITTTAHSAKILQVTTTLTTTEGSAPSLVAMTTATREPPSARVTANRAAFSPPKRPPMPDGNSISAPCQRESSAISSSGRMAWRGTCTAPLRSMGRRMAVVGIPRIFMPRFELCLDIQVFDRGRRR